MPADFFANPHQFLATGNERSSSRKIGSPLSLRLGDGR